jgi:hypothetical protein
VPWKTVPDGARIVDDGDSAVAVPLQPEAAAARRDVNIPPLTPSTSCFSNGFLN